MVTDLASYFQIGASSDDECKLNLVVTIQHICDSIFLSQQAHLTAKE